MNKNIEIINKFLEEVSLPVFGSLEFKFQNSSIVDIIRIDKVNKKKLLMKG